MGGTDSGGRLRGDEVRLAVPVCLTGVTNAFRGESIDGREAGFRCGVEANLVGDDDDGGGGFAVDRASDACTAVGLAGLADRVEDPDTDGGDVRVELDRRRLLLLGVRWWPAPGRPVRCNRVSRTENTLSTAYRVEF